MADLIPYLPHVNAALNSLATLLLLAGYLFIQLRREDWHRNAMIGALVVSALFLTSYLIYHFHVHSRPFPEYPGTAIRYTYYAILLTHVVLAIAVPPLAIASIWLGFADDRHRHRAVGWWAFPIWLYVSVTGVVVYLMLYQIFPPRAEEPKIDAEVRTANSAGSNWPGSIARE